MEPLGLFGGSFDPPHMGHVWACSRARGATGIGEVVWIPCRQQPHKEGHGASALIRLEMTRYTANLLGDSVWDIEVVRTGPSYMIDTLREAKARWSNRPLVLFVGRDTYASMHLWHEAEKVSQLVRVVPVERGRPEGIELSSSEIREKVRNGKDIGGLVVPEVQDLINELGLYR